MTEPLRALLIDASPTDAKLVARALRAAARPISWERIDGADALREALGSARWDVVLSDWTLPGFDALAALGVVRGGAAERASPPDTPFIIVSGTLGEEKAVLAMRSGADDFITKDNLARLVPAVERECREAEARERLRAADAERRQLEARYQRLLETTSEGVVTTDARGRVTFANARLAGLLGCDVPDVVGRRWVELVAPAGRAVVERSLEGALAGRRGPAVEIPLTHRAGGETWVILDGLGVVDDAGRIDGYLGVMTDVTERRGAEDARRNAEDALARSLEQLRHAQKMEAVGRLAGGVAHDFNNLLTVILSYGALLELEIARDSRAGTDLAELMTAGRRAAELTRQLLLFSRQQAAEPRAIDLNEVLASMERMCRRIVGEDVALVTRLGEGLGPILIDPSSLEQVIMNLVVNARDAMPGGGQLELATAAVELDEVAAKARPGLFPGAHVRLTVSDSGHGMDETTRARIFEPFFTTKEVGKGTGLGLSTVLGIVQQAHGHVAVDSAVGRGTTFQIHFPRADRRRDTPASGTVVGRLGGSEAVLVVEDDDQVRTLMSNVLRRRGYRVLDARTPSEALHELEHHGLAIDLLLTDVVLPGMSGIELARQVRDAQPEVKILFVSGYIGNSGAPPLDEPGTGFLQKPLVPESMLRKVRELLG